MNIAIILARGGSKGLPGKNILPLFGKPLIAWSIEAALESGSFDCVVVSSDDDEILTRAHESGALTLKRPEYLAIDTASSFDAMMHALNTLEQEKKTLFTAVSLLQPTSPLRTAQHIREAFDLLTDQVEGVISVYRPETHPMKAYRIDNGCISGLYSPDAPYQPRQTLPECCYANGAIYLFHRKALEMHSGFPKDKLAPYFMPLISSTDIDTRQDLETVENIMRGHNEDIS